MEKVVDKMILYKNVDIKDLDSILQQGILSMNECENDNWDDDKRADNSRDVVYLFSPLTEENSFCQYGVTLLEIDIPDNMVKENELGICDVNKGKYIEYIVDKVSPKYIKSIYVPKLFKNRIEHYKGVSSNTLSHITWCDLYANHCGDNGIEICPDDILKRFVETAEIMDAGTFNFFRGTKENREVIDLYNIRYIF